MEHLPSNHLAKGIASFLALVRRCQPEPTRSMKITGIPHFSEGNTACNRSGFQLSENEGDRGSTSRTLLTVHQEIGERQGIDRKRIRRVDPEIGILNACLREDVSQSLEELAHAD